MRKLFNSFYIRLSLILFVLITIIGTSCIVIAFYFSGHLFDEVEQLLNREYAGSIAQEIQPMIKEGFAEDRIKSAIHYMMVLNPMVEIYILNDRGKILVYFSQSHEEILKQEVDLAPIHAFMTHSDRTFILGDDPRSDARQKPFSAAPIQMGEETGYIYIILGGQAYDETLASIRSGYYAKVAFIALSLTLLLTLITGFLLFFFLTNRLRVLNRAISTFDEGVPFQPLEIKGNDEIGSIGRAFNGMAASIAEGVEKLKNAEEMRKQLVANISHDLRSPLASIMGYVETIQMKDPSLTPEKRREFLEIILRNVTGVRKLVKELFDFVMLETKQIEPHIETFNLHELAQDIVLKVKTQADEARVELLLDSPRDLSLVSGDIGMVERAVTNLLENGIRFTPEGKSVTLNLSKTDKAVQISVIDTGQGIAPEELPYIFDRYFHGKKNKDRSTGKTGLGLAITKQIAELHGSTLFVESELGRGTSFTFILPAARL